MCNAQRRYDEAERLYKEALTMREHLLGPDDPEVAGTLGNLAASYAAQGRYAEAEPLYERALAIHEKKLDPDHPYRVRLLKAMESFYQRAGRLDRVQALRKQRGTEVGWIEMYTTPKSSDHLKKP